MTQIKDSMKTIHLALTTLLTMKDDYSQLHQKVSCHGICSYLEGFEHDLCHPSRRTWRNAKEQTQLFDGWEFHSGRKSYPVPENHGLIAANEKESRIICEDSAELQYDRSGLNEMWIEGEYAELRWNLVEFCIAKIESGFELETR